MEQNEGRALTSPAAVHGITESKESRFWSNLLVFFCLGSKTKKENSQGSMQTIAVLFVLSPVNQKSLIR